MTEEANKLEEKPVPRFREGNIVKSSYGPNVYWKVVEPHVRDNGWKYGYRVSYTLVRFAKGDGELYSNPVATSEYSEEYLSSAQEFLTTEIEKLEEEKLKLSRLSNAISTSKRMAAIQKLECPYQDLVGKLCIIDHPGFNADPEEYSRATAFLARPYHPDETLEEHIEKVQQNWDATPSIPVNSTTVQVAYSDLHRDGFVLIDIAKVQIHFVDYLFLKLLLPKHGLLFGRGRGSLKFLTLDEE